MIKELLENLNYFFDLTFMPKVLWEVLPLAGATVLVLLYSEIYKEEHGGWGSRLSNSLVLLFVSMGLLRYIYGINELGFQNYLDFSDKFIATMLLLLVSSLMIRINFAHLLPDKIAKYLGSTLSVNLLAYVVILFVYSEYSFSWIGIFALFIILTGLGTMFTLAKFPIKRMREYIEKEKKDERIKDAKEAVFEIQELKEEVKKREEELKKVKIKKAEEEKKEGIKLKKIYRKAKI
jgi:hypothetical protein